MGRIHFLHWLAKPLAGHLRHVVLGRIVERALEREHGAAVFPLRLDAGEGITLERQGHGEEVLNVGTGEERVVVNRQQVLGRIDELLHHPGVHLVPERTSAHRRANAQRHECLDPREVIGRKTHARHRQDGFDANVHLSATDFDEHGQPHKRERAAPNGAARLALHRCQAVRLTHQRGR